ncbi:MAG TPA: hypothetical protein VMQ76_10815 [Terracidiphilus sp.]|nr:hypothetical protein [Terracidiphilus sp.]
MTANELIARFPHASSDLVRLNADAGQADIQPNSAGTPAVVEQHSCDGRMGAVQVEGRIGKRLLIRITATRTRLLDEDNLAEKYHVDLLRYASGGALGDSPATTHIEVAQQKAGPGEPEEVRLEVFEC